MNYFFRPAIAIIYVCFVVLFGVTAATVTAVLAQRLVRRLCIFCRVRRPVTGAERAELGLDDGDHHLFSATGCPLCDRGYRGQVGVHQLMIMDDDLRQLTLDRARMLDPLARVAPGAHAVQRGAKALSGLTTLTAQASRPSKTPH